jgi:hypothetical protein
MKTGRLSVLLTLMFVGVIAANSFSDDSHFVRLGPRTGSRLSRQLGLYDAPYIDTSDPLRHGYGADVLAFRFDKAGRLLLSPAYIANAEVNEFYTRRIGSLIRELATVRDVESLFGRPQAVSPRPGGSIHYYTIEVFNPFEQRGGDRH